jgi:hypothetical protein
MQRALDGILVAYLLAHGVIGLLIDIQSIVPDLSSQLYAVYQDLGLTAPVPNRLNRLIV